MADHVEVGQEGEGRVERRERQVAMPVVTLLYVPSDSLICAGLVVTLLYTGRDSLVCWSWLSYMLVVTLLYVPDHVEVGEEGEGRVERRERQVANRALHPSRGQCLLSSSSSLLSLQVLAGP